eukprot:CAMPEP_0194210584 /NCGR_PEP_ID=MMETSP0156-20130528/8765_1 /TAXON_ID=33649 /ORGANISM="Thalassionema nitzschioides, Strain L26-B" /LENGTH=344 /DNA_ID=CAMNT_0038937947 /DNA_START=146 /DNA_END=1180 /DNA_ORIENTATION=+
MSKKSESAPLRRKLLADEPKSYELPPEALRWCRPSEQNPLNYRSCDKNGKFNKIPFMAGLTNGLKMLLLMVIESYERNECFFVSEEHNHLLIREDKSQQLSTFIGRYFEHIGLSKHDSWVKLAVEEDRVQDMQWEEVWNKMEKRRIHGDLHNITSLSYHNLESTILKKVMLDRMWRLQPHVRDGACQSLESHGLKDEYMAFSVRRGDKGTEGFNFTKPEEYIEAAEQKVIEHFGGVVPKIFVAADDCESLKEFRALRPDWVFESECDQSAGHNGFILAEMKQWTLEETDEHYRKFFVELIGLAGAKFYIGVAYTNVAWWVTYMRLHRWSHLFLDTHTQSALDRW